MPEKTSKQNKSPLDVYQEFQPFSFFLTKVQDIPVKYNATGAFNLRGKDAYLKNIFSPNKIKK